MRQKCPLCDSSNTDNKKIFQRDFSGMNEIVPFSKYDVYACKNCGLVYAGDIEETMPLDEYYVSVSKYERPGWSEQPIVFDLDLEAARFINECATKGDVRSSVLDIGCGAGGMLSALKNMGYADICGVEPSKKNALLAKTHYGINVYVGILGEEIQELCGKKFDVVAMKGVLEHLLSPKTSVIDMLNYLSPSGKIVIEVPDVDLFYKRKNLYQEFSVEHVNFFSKNSLIELFRQFGLYLESFARNDKHGAILTLWSRSENTLQKYLDDAEMLAKMITKKIEAIDGEFYIWGAGTHTAMLYQLGIIDNSKVKGIIDMNFNYTGKYCYGHSIMTPEFIDCKVPILISSQDAQEEIVAYIKLNHKNPVITLY